MVVQLEAGSLSGGFCCEPRWTEALDHPASLLSRTAHSIISAMMSARAGGPRNTHQQKDYPSPYHGRSSLAMGSLSLSLYPLLLSPNLPVSLSSCLSFSLAHLRFDLHDLLPPVAPDISSYAG